MKIGIAEKETRISIAKSSEQTIALLEKSVELENTLIIEIKRSNEMKERELKIEEEKLELEKHRVQMYQAKLEYKRRKLELTSAKNSNKNL